MEALPAAGSRQQRMTFITMIGAACEKAHAIIKDLLLMGELESRTLTVSKQTVDLNHFIESQVALLQVTAQQKGVTILVHVPPGVVRVPIHPEKFARVLDNLLSNAVKFTPLALHIDNYRLKSRLKQPKSALFKMSISSGEAHSGYEPLAHGVVGGVLGTLQ